MIKRLREGLKLGQDLEMPLLCCKKDVRFDSCGLIEFHRIIKNNKLLALLAGNNRRNVKIKIIAVKIKHDIIQSMAVAPALLQMRMLACCLLLG